MGKETIQKALTSDYVAPSECKLMWVFIDQPGKPGPNPESKNRLVASLQMKTESEGCKALTKLIDDYWAENKPKGRKCKSKGYQVVKKKTGEVDDDDLPIMEDTDETVFQFWTGTHWPDGSEHKIDIYNAKGKKVSLGNKKIGNESQGAISFAMDIYDNGPSATGVTLYLNAIQLTKFVEFTNDAGFNDLGGDDDEGFDGIESEFEETASSDEGDSGAAKPRL